MTNLREPGRMAAVRGVFTSMTPHGTDRAGAVTQPVLVLVGDKDRAAFRSWPDIRLGTYHKGRGW
ncbi:hypothetical protein [Micromonospora lupini]|uniref:hypothetical protein n=1 Tax=Micromonospora lupini TaxID=285679 RepID=UPI00031CDBEA|nr:hypothetical protein [Micromonospora lupini]